MKVTKGMLSSAEAAVYLDKSEGTLRNWRYRDERGAPPFYTVKGNIYYKLQELDTWIEKGVLK